MEGSYCDVQENGFTDQKLFFAFLQRFIAFVNFTRGKLYGNNEGENKDKDDKDENEAIKTDKEPSEHMQSVLLVVDGHKSRVSEIICVF